MHFFTFFSLLGDTGRYVPRFVVYIVLRQTKNRNHYEKDLAYDSHYDVHCDGELQCHPDDYQRVSVLPTG